jgi:hypothetical protein
MFPVGVSAESIKEDRGEIPSFESEVVFKGEATVERFVVEMSKVRV